MRWYVDCDGVILNANSQPIGFFDVNGDVYDRKGIGGLGVPVGSPVGFVDIAGDAYDQTTQHRGFADVDGTIYNFARLAVATVTPAGEVYSLAGQPLGSVNPALHEAVSHADWRPMPFRAAAAVLFLIFHSD